MLICAFATLLLNLYMGNIEDLRKTLQKLPEAMEVSAKISNLDGSMDQGLKIEAELVSNLLTSGHVSEPSVTVQLLAGFGFFSQEEWQANLTLQARGVNSLAGAGLRQENITLQEGSTLDFLAEDGQKCLLDRSVMEENGYVTGDPAHQSGGKQLHTGGYSFSGGFFFIYGEKSAGIKRVQGGDAQLRAAPGVRGVGASL